MPFPFIYAAAIAAATAIGAIGVKKGYRATQNFNKVNKLIEKRDKIIESSNSWLDDYKDKLNKSLENYGRFKVNILRHEIKDFIINFKKIKEIDFVLSNEQQYVDFDNFTPNELKELTHAAEIAVELGKGLTAGTIGGGLVALGAYNGAMTLAKTSSGTATSTLSNIASRNATLTWLGGGTLAAGGFGMTGGMLILGGFVAAPALLIGGYILEANSETKLYEVKEEIEKARTYQNQVRINIQQIKKIISVVGAAKKVLYHTSQDLKETIFIMKKNFKKYGYDYALYPRDAQEVVINALVDAQLIKHILDTPILDSNGNLVVAKEYFQNFI